MGDSFDVKWEGLSQASDRGPPNESKRTRGRTWRALAVIGCVAVCLAAATLLLRPDPERRLAEARALLDGLWFPENERARLTRGQRAEAALRRYLQEGGEERSGADVLLAASLVAQARDQTPLGNGEIRRLLAEARPAECSTQDLVIAASLFQSGDRLAEADRLITAALKNLDHRQAVLRRSINIRFYLGRDEEVLEHCRELASLDPEDAYPLLVTGAVYENQVQWDNLIEVDRKLIELAPPEVDEIRHRLVGSLITTGRADEARKQYEQLKADAPGLLAQSPLTEARLLHLEGKSEEALALAQRILAASPDDAQALLLAGRIQLAQSKMEQAVQTLGRLIKIDPTDNEAHYLLAQAYVRSGDTERANHHLALHRRVLDLKVKLYGLERRANRNPADVDVRLTIAELYEELGWTEQVQFWRQAAESARSLQR